MSLDEMITDDMIAPPESPDLKPAKEQVDIGKGQHDLDIHELFDMIKD
jgi:hypothetical protein